MPFRFQNLEKSRFENRVFNTGFRYFLSFPHAQGFVPRRQNRYVLTTFVVICKRDRYENQEQNLIVKPIRKRSSLIFSSQVKQTFKNRFTCNLNQC